MNNDQANNELILLRNIPLAVRAIGMLTSYKSEISKEIKRRIQLIDDHIAAIDSIHRNPDQLEMFDCNEYFSANPEIESILANPTQDL